MTEARENVVDYLKQFYLLGKDEVLNCDNIIPILYGVILNKFRTTFNEAEYAYFKEYQERVFNMIEDLREKNSATLGVVLTYLGEKNPYLADILIMLWCLPRTDDYLSKKIYNNRYRSNIEKYNKKLTKNINHPIVRNFCIETVTKTNNVPVHCIDILWKYMDTLSIQFDYYNIANCSYIGFTAPVKTEPGPLTGISFTVPVKTEPGPPSWVGFTVPVKTEPEKKDAYITVGLDMEYILDMGLGKTVYADDPKGPFINVIKNFVSNEEIIKEAIANQNYHRQFSNINKNYVKYFGSDYGKLSSEKIKEFVKVNTLQ